ncbi:hypothetical protein GCM10022226_02310 [Sphaerisporangium flaviroseum]|uniref:Transposase n=1 Tax=Sphaerisporangium flaviroseum TaxID=509199 RepID=A0ABP7H9L7_9ACTN
MAQREKIHVSRDMLDDWVRTTRAALAPFLKREQEAERGGRGTTVRPKPDRAPDPTADQSTPASCTSSAI